MPYRLAFDDLTLRHPEYWGGEQGRTYPVVLQTNGDADTNLTLARIDLFDYLRSVDGTPATEPPATVTPRLMDHEEFPDGFTPCVNVDERGTWIRTWLAQSGLRWAEPLSKERQELLQEFDNRRNRLLRQLGLEPVNYWKRRQQIIKGEITHVDGLGPLSLYKEVN